MFVFPAVLEQYDKHVEEMSKQLKSRAQSQSENLEKKLEEKRELMKQRVSSQDRHIGLGHNPQHIVDP